MTTKFDDFKESMIGELTDLIKNQAQAISLPDLDQLMSICRRYAHALPRFRRRNIHTYQTSLNSSVFSSRSRLLGGATIWQRSQWVKRRLHWSIFSKRPI